MLLHGVIVQSSSVIGECLIWVYFAGTELRMSLARPLLQRILLSGGVLISNLRKANMYTPLILPCRSLWNSCPQLSSPLHYCCNYCCLSFCLSSLTAVVAPRSPLPSPFSPPGSCVASKLQELNSMVTVKVTSGKLTEEVVGAHGVVVMCGQPGEEVAKWDAFCHEKVSTRSPSPGPSLPQPAASFPTLTVTVPLALARYRVVNPSP